MKRWGICAGVVLPVLMLGGCGGGGGSGVASTPPPPNTSLADLQYSESFANVATTGNASFPKSGAAPTSSIASNALTANYDAGSKAYTITVAGRSQKFLPADIDASLSNGRIAVYVKTSGNMTDSLTLTKPGTSGHNYEFAGAGFWQHTIDGASSVSESLDAFTFGVSTPDTAIPRTGRAEYPIDLLGAETTATTVFGLAGSGLTQIDFAAGTVITHGSFTAPINGNTTFSSEARLSGTGGTFSGTFRFDDSGLFTGGLSGRMFGPQAQEIGGAFSASQNDGRIAVGAIVGRGGTVSATNASVVSPANNEFFTNDDARIAAMLDNGAGTFSSASQNKAPLVVNYDASRQKYTLIADSRSQFFGTLNMTSGGTSDSLSFVAPTGYQYVRGGEWRSSTISGNSVRYAIDDFTYGAETPDGALPRVGTAGYAAQISGTAADGDYHHLVSFSGKGTVTANFATGAISATGGVHFSDETPLGPVAVANGAFSASATLSSTANLFSGSVTMTGIGSYSGTIDGRFHGPTAEELGAAFHLSGGSGDVASGLIVAQRDGNVLQVPPALTALTQATIFDNSRYLLLRSGVASISSASSLAFDPASGTYTFNATGDGIPAPAQISFGAAELQSAQSDASYMRYASAGGADPSFAVTVLNPAAGNPTIALTYTSFADIDLITISNGTAAESRYYYPFGVDTPTVQLPQFGTASYAGVLYGRGRLVDPLNVPSRYTLSGTSTLNVDFGAATFSNTLNNVTGTETMTSAVKTFGDFTAQGSIGANGIMVGSFNTGSASDFRGSFFGPNAAEYGAVFTINRVDGSGTLGLNGVTVGKR